MQRKIFIKNANLINWLKNNYIIVLILLALLAMTVSMVIGLSQSVWFDEAYSIMLAKQPVAQLIHLTSLDTHPPFYYLLLNVWGNLFGWDEFALRSLSVICMGGTAIVAGLLTKKLFNVKVAYFTLPFIFFAPFLLRYGFEIRMYSLASLIGIVATYILILALESKAKQKLSLFIIYAILVALGMLTLYYTALLWIAHFVWLLWISYKNKEIILKSMWLKSFVGSVILFFPWLPTFISQISNGALAPISQSMTIDNLLGILSFSFLYRPIWQLGPLLSLVLLFVIVMLVYLSMQALHIVNEKQKKYLILFVMYFAIPIVILTFVGLVRPMYVERYLSHVLIGFSLYLGVIVSLIFFKANWIIKTLSTLMIMTFLIGVTQLVQVGNFNFQRMQKPDIASAAMFTSNCSSGNVILAADPYVAIELSYYLPSCKINFYSNTAKLGGGYSALSNNDLRVANPQTDLVSANSIDYIYYGESKLKMPSNMILIKTLTSDNLIVERYRSKNQ